MILLPVMQIVHCRTSLSEYVCGSSKVHTVACVSIYSLKIFHTFNIRSLTPIFPHCEISYDYVSLGLSMTQLFLSTFPQLTGHLLVLLVVAMLLLSRVHWCS